MQPLNLCRNGRGLAVVLNPLAPVHVGGITNCTDSRFKEAEEGLKEGSVFRGSVLRAKH